jgi:hypothetical protein
LYASAALLGDYKFTTIGGQSEGDWRAALAYDGGIGFRLPTDAQVSWAFFIRSEQYPEAVRRRLACVAQPR